MRRRLARNLSLTFITSALLAATLTGTAQSAPPVLAARAAGDIWVPRQVTLADRSVRPRRSSLVSLRRIFSGTPTAPQAARLLVTIGRSPQPGRVRVQVGSQSQTLRYTRRGMRQRLTVPVTSPRTARVTNLGRAIIRIRVGAIGYWRSQQVVAPPSAGPGTPAPTSSDGRVDLSGASFSDVWVNGSSGSDTNSGGSRDQALRTVRAAWNRIPANQSLNQGYRIQVTAGTYNSSALVNYWENRFGTAEHPIMINAVDGPGTVTFTGDINMFNTRHFYLSGIKIYRNGDTFHCEQCSNIVLRDSEFNGDVTPGGDEAHETIKVNQSQYVYIEDSVVRGAGDNAIDFVAVQHGHLLGNNVSHADDWCAYVKGGSAHILVSENEFSTCGTGGFVAGQGTGLEFMTAPWLNYEAVGIRVVNNVIHDTTGAGLGVNGGYNVLLAYNTMYRVGSRSHGVEFVFGMRSCDAASAGQSVAGCNERLAVGGWGVANTNSADIGNKHVYFYNNVLLNPSGFRSAWQHFAIYGPRSQPSGVQHAPNPARSDSDLRIAGNVIWNGPSDLPLGNDGACLDSNPTCTSTLIRANNSINSWLPALTNPGSGDFTPLANSQLANSAAAPIPSFGWGDAPTAGMGESWTDNSVPRNRIGEARDGWGRPGAF